MWTNWERTLVQFSESPNCRSATENIFREVIKWTSYVSLGNASLFWNLDWISLNKFVIKSKDVNFDIRLKTILCGINVIIKVVMHKKKTVIRIITNSELVKSELKVFNVSSFVKSIQTWRHAAFELDFVLPYFCRIFVRIIYAYITFEWNFNMELCNTKHFMWVNACYRVVFLL
jgi:hypothetical protein